MKKSQVIAIVRTLDKSEVREFRKWLLSPVHNQREDVVQLFDYLMVANHLEEDKFLQKERVYRKIFGKEAYNDAKLRQTNHFLLKSLEEYFNYQINVSDEISTKIGLIKNYRRRNLLRLVRKNLDQTAGLLEASDLRNEDYYWNQYEYQQERYNYLSLLQKSSELELQEVSDALEKAYITEKLIWSCRLIFHQTIYRKNYDLGLLQPVLQMVEERNLTGEPAIAIYFHVLKAMTDKEDDHLHFEKLRMDIVKYENHFPRPQLKEIYQMAINYSVRKTNAGLATFQREIFEWYRQGILSKVLIESEKLSPATYSNTVTASLQVGEFEWAEKFIDEYKAMLPKKERDNLSHFSKAKLFFTRKDYKRAMVLLAQAEYHNILINLNAKSMLIKMYYELDEMEALEFLLESMRIYIRRKEVIGYHSNLYLRLIQFTKKLIRINRYDKEKMAKLRTEIQTANPLPERQWLLEQLDKL
ncbi:MAG: hypothetical protein R2824_08800 [Saprospiraceae bacterium]|nr:hypothetical protein [Lewinella sp.]